MVVRCSVDPSLSSIAKLSPLAIGTALNSLNSTASAVPFPPLRPTPATLVVRYVALMLFALTSAVTLAPAVTVKSIVVPSTKLPAVKITPSRVASGTLSFPSPPTVIFVPPRYVPSWLTVVRCSVDPSLSNTRKLSPLAKAVALYSLISRVIVTVSVALAAVVIPSPPAIYKVLPSLIVWSDPLSALKVKLLIVPKPATKLARLTFLRSESVASQINKKSFVPSTDVIAV